MIIQLILPIGLGMFKLLLVKLVQYSQYSIGMFICYTYDTNAKLKKNTHTHKKQLRLKISQTCRHTENNTMNKNIMKFNTHYDKYEISQKHKKLKKVTKIQI